MDTYKSNRHIYEEDLLERVVLPYLGATDVEPSDVVRLEAVKVNNDGKQRGERNLSLF